MLIEDRLAKAEIMAGDRVVATVADGRCEVIDEQLCPYCIAAVKDASLWLERRSIDLDRPNARTLTGILGIPQSYKVPPALYVHGACLTDDYWIRPAGETLTWNDVRFRRNDFADLALCGDASALTTTERDVKTPELTNIGSFEKCWRLIDNAWWMVKAGTPEEHFSEMFVYELGKRMGLEMAEYRRSDGYIYSRNFCEDMWNLEHMMSIARADADEAESYDILCSCCREAAMSYTGMLYLDALVLNMDRHLENYGVLRDRQTGRAVKLAPLYDHNIALVSRGLPRNLDRGGDLLQRDFIDLLAHNMDARNDFQSLDLIHPDSRMVREAFEAAYADEDSECQFTEKDIEQMVLSAERWMDRKMQEIFQK